MARVPTAAAALSLLVLAACDLTLPWSEGTSPGSGGTLSASPEHLELSARVGDEPPAPVSIAVQNRTGFALGIEYDRAFFASVSALGDTLSVVPLYPDLLGPGIHTSEILLWPCRPEPAGCRAVAGAVPLVIPVRYAVEPSLLAVSPSPIALEWVDLVSRDPSVTVTIDDPAGSGPWTAELLPADRCGAGNLVLPESAGTGLPAQLVIQAITSSLSFESTCTKELRVTKGRAQVSVPVTLTARFPLLASDPPIAALTGVAYQLPLGAPQVVTVAGGARVPIWTQLSPSDWLEVRATSSDPLQFTFRPTRSDLVPGTYSATLEVRPANPAAPATSIPVTYTLASRALEVRPFRWGLVVSSDTLPSALAQSVELRDGGTPLTWTATSSAPWLQVSPAAGTTGPGAQVELAVLAPALEPVPQGLQEAEVAFTYDLPGGGAERVVVSVGLDMWLPHLERLLPRVVAAGQESRVATYGLEGTAGFYLNGPPAWIHGWGAHATFWTISPQPAGSYPLPVPNQLGLSRSKASVQVKEPITRSAAAVDAPGRKTRLFLDDAAEVLYAPNPGEGTLDRYRASTGWARETLALDGLRDAALATDGATLAVVAGGEVKVVDTSTFALSSAQPGAPAIPEAGASSLDWRIAYGIDGAALLIPASAEGGLHVFDGASVTPLPGGPRGWGEAVANGDGGAIWMVRPDEPALPVAFYQPDFSEYRPLGTSFAASHVAPDRGGAFVLLVHDGAASETSDSMLLDHRFLAPASGKLPRTVANAVLTQDGTRAVAWDPVAGTVRVFDLVGALVEGLFPEIGAGTVPAGDPGAGAAMVLSVDDRTLFLAGDQRLAVVPLP